MEEVFFHKLRLMHRLNQLFTYSYLSIIGVCLIFLVDISLYVLKGDLRYIQAIIFLSIIPIIFLFLFPFLQIDSKNSPRDRNPLITTASIISIMLGVTLASISLLIYSLPYERPISFFISLSFASTVLLWEITKFQNQKMVIPLLLTVIFISLILRLVPLSLIPGLYFDDPAFHEGFTIKIILEGQVPLGSSYTNFSLMHILEATICEICKVNFKEATILSITTLQASIMPLFIFLISRWVFERTSYIDGTRVGLCAAFLFVISDVPIRYGLLGAFPTNYASLLLIAIFYLILSKGSIKIFGFVSFFLLVALILSHSLTPIALLLFLAASILFKQIYLYCFYLPFRVKLRFGFFITCILVTSAYLMYAAGFHFNKLIEMLFFQDSGVVASFSTQGGISYSQTIPVYEYILNTLPQVLLVSIALVSVFFIVPRLNLFTEATLIVGLSLLVYVFGAFGFVFGLGNAPDRFMFYSFLLLPIGSAFGLILLTKSPRIGKILFIFVIVTLPFLMMGDSTSNVDHPIFAPDLTPQRHITEAELISLENVFRISQKPASSDNDVLYLQMKYGFDDRIKKANFFTVSNLLMQDDVIVRSFYTSRPIFSKGLYRIDYDLYQILDETRSKIFCSQTISYYVLR